QRIAAELNAGLCGLRGATTPTVHPGATHVYYVYGMTLDIKAIGVPRARLVEALRAEGVPALVVGYQNLHMLPMFRHKTAYGTKGFPWNSPYCTSDVQYGPGVCPTAEKLHDETFLGIGICMNELPSADVALIVEAFDKVWSQLDALRSAQ
ncbi:MAG: DegT/DnrJ/EryC1/StrS family aminotransferase, partial [Proteobacteria bacterium]|nr:DegT/DnrJ/EryC1/StrS family aminotransferase [Pseudomonadota bacterium]